MNTKMKSLLRHVQLFQLEKNELVKLSALNQVSVYPKPIERQKVSTCLKIFNEKTVAALKSNSSIDEEEVKGTIIFLGKF